MIYLTTFIISLFFIRIADFFKNNKILFAITTIIGLLFPILLYAGRDDTVGFDVNVYVEPFFNIACESHSFSYLRQNVSTDIVYLLINYIVSRFSHDIFWLHFVIQTTILSCIYYCAYSNRKFFPIWFSVFLYYVLMYCATMNIVRQSIAVGFSLVSVNFYLHHKVVKSYVFFAIACLSHITAIITILFYFMNAIVKLKNKKLKMAIIISFLLIMIAFTFSFRNTVSFILVTGGDAAYRYSGYLTPDEFGLSKFDIFSKLSFMGILLCAMKMKLFNGHMLQFFLLTIIMTLLMTLLNLIAAKAGRFAFYFYDISFIFIPLIFYSRRFFSNSIRMVIRWSFVIFLLIAWYSMYVIHGEDSGNLYPYKSEVYKEVIL